MSQQFLVLDIDQATPIEDRAERYVLDISKKFWSLCRSTWADVRHAGEEMEPRPRNRELAVQLVGERRTRHYGLGDSPDGLTLSRALTNLEFMMPSK